MAKPTKAPEPAPRRRDIPNTRKFTIIAQDPSVTVNGRILTTEIEVPAEELLPGPCGYRVNVIDYDASTSTLYSPTVYVTGANGAARDRFALKHTAAGKTKRARNQDARLLPNPHFHAQHVYAIVIKTLSRFKRTQCARVPWDPTAISFTSRRAFADANAFYSKEDRGLFFGYFADQGVSRYSPACRTMWSR